MLEDLKAERHEKYVPVIVCQRLENCIKETEVGKPSSSSLCYFSLMYSLKSSKCDALKPNVCTVINFLQLEIQKLLKQNGFLEKKIDVSCLYQ